MNMSDHEEVPEGTESHQHGLEGAMGLEGITDTRVPQGVIHRHTIPGETSGVFDDSMDGGRRIMDLALLIKMAGEDGGPVVDGGLERDAWEQVLHQATGEIPARVMVIDNTRCVFELYDGGCPVSVIAQRINQICTYDGKAVRTRCHLRESRDMYIELQREREDAVRQNETYASVAGRIQKDREEVLELKATLQQELLTLREKVSQVNVGDKGVQYHNRDLRFKPQIGTFSGTLPVQRGEVGFKVWKHQVLAALAAHSRQSVRGTMLASITGPASTALEFIGMESSIEDILKEFQRRYLQSKTVDQWRREFFDLMQGPKESILSLTTSLEFAFTCLKEVDPSIDRSVLKTRFFQSLHPRMRDSLRYSFDKEDSTYESLMDAALIIEGERGGTKTLVNGVTQAEDKGIPKTETEDRWKSQIDNINKKVTSVGEEMIKKLEGMALQVQSLKLDSPKKETGATPKQPRRNDYGRRTFPKPETTTAGPFEPGDRNIQCFRCGGWNHMAKYCATQGKVNWRELNRGVLSPKKTEEKAPESK